MEQSEISVIIIDDNKELCNILKDYLSYQDDIIVKAVGNDGIEGLRLIEVHKPDLVILDMVMPKLDGIGVLENLNNLNLSKPPKIAILSSVGTDTVIQKALSLGADYYIAKPFNFEVFVQRVREIFHPSIHMNKNNEKMTSLKSLDNKLFVSDGSNVEQHITNIIHALGIPNHLKGYSFIISAINLVVSDDNLLPFVIKDLYDSIGKRYNTTPIRVERAIRNAIEIAWSKEKPDALDQILGYKVGKDKKRPTNSELISILALKLKTESNMT